MTDNATDFSSDMAFLNNKTDGELAAIASSVLAVDIEKISAMKREDILSSIAAGKVVTTKKKPSRKKAPAKEATSETPVEVPAETPAEQAPTAESEAPAEPAEPAKEEDSSKITKPAPKKRTKKKTQGEAAKTEASVEEPKETPKETPEVSETPKKRRTSKKKAPEAAVEAVVEAEAEITAPEEKVEAAAEPEKKPRTRRSRKKKTEAEVAPVEAENAEPSEAEKNSDSEPASEDAQPKAKKKSVKTKKKKYSFGPEQETKRIDNPDEEVSVSEELPSATEEAAEAAEPAPEKPDPELSYVRIEGILSIQNQEKGDYCGFVHCRNYLPSEGDAYVPGQIIRKCGLRKGDELVVMAAPPRGKERYAPVKRLVSVNGIEITEDFDFDILRKRNKFENLTAIYPDSRLTLETEEEDMSTRIIDLFCPIGKGQRGMIVSPPKAGKTILLKRVANSISANNPDCKLIVLLIDERPEEVTDMQRSIKGEVVFSTFDKKPENHVKVTELVLERAMRLVELGQDVVILLDSMTRLARAYNLTITPTGRTLSGGLDPGSLYGPKRFFGAARNIENGGSLTIVSTALIETGSRMDEVIFEEFKGTGNMEVNLDRKLADRRVFPAIAIEKSGTRREDLLLSKSELATEWRARKAIADADTVAATMGIINLLKKTSSNAFFVENGPKL